MIQAAVSRMTEKEYIEFELKSEHRHEHVDGQLFEMPGEKKKNNRLAQPFARRFEDTLEPRGYQVYTNDIKVRIPNRDRYYYPDVMVTNEPDMPDDEYIVRAPAILAEVVSPSSRTNDYADKFRDYTEIPLLEYYLITEPEEAHVTVYERDADY